ncbi:MAG: hypothetical protein ACRDRP_19150 [Pseudonocardiaceae bacterium]
MALADPTPAGQTRLLAGMGSDTTEDVMNVLSEVPPNGSEVIASYNASGSPNPVRTKAPINGDCLLNRAVGSTNGVRALRDERAAAAAANPQRRPCLDFARSSANTSQAAEFNGTGLTYIPFASDQVSIVTRFDGLLAPNFTPAQLSAIFRCTAAGTIANPPTIVPLLPQAGSGTVNFFLSSIGITEAQVGTCVGRADLTVNPPTPLLENKGNRMTDPRNIMPHSAAQFFAQYYDVIADEKDRAEIKRVNNIVPTSPTFPFQREVFNVIPTNEINNAPYSTTFVGGASAVCSSPGEVTRLGFGLLPAGRCGAIDPLLQTPGGAGINLPGPTT